MAEPTRAAIFTNRDGALRLYDGTGTPYFVEFVFEDGNINHPLGRNEPEQIPLYDRGRMDSNTAYIEGPDRTLDPLTLTFSFKLSVVDPGFRKFRSAMNLDLAATWTVGPHTWVSTKGTTTLLSGGPTRTAFTTPIFASSRMRTVNVEYLLTDPRTSGTRHVGYRLGEVYYEPSSQQLAEGDDGVTISCTGLVYGAVTEITAFSAGTNSG